MIDAESEPDVEQRDVVDDVLDEIGVAHLATREQHREAIGAAVDLLQEGPQSRSDFVDELHPEFDAGYENARTWWRKVVKPALKEHPDVETPVGGMPWKLQENAK